MFWLWGLLWCSGGAGTVSYLALKLIENEQAVLLIIPNSEGLAQNQAMGSLPSLGERGRTLRRILQAGVSLCKSSQKVR